MYRPLPPSADISMLLYLLSATGAVAGLALIFFAVVMAPTVVANTAGIPRPAQVAVLLNPTAYKARMETERLAIAKAEEMNRELGLKTMQNFEQPAAAPTQGPIKQRRVTQTRRGTRVARPNDSRQNAGGYEPQKTFTLSWR
jgi:hypothetical protein